MNELIPINYNEERMTVSARDLHQRLEIKTQYTKWFERMCSYGFVENTDFILVSQKSLTNNPKNPYTEITDHQITINMAKELCMLQRNEMGKKFRQYFIEVEEQWNRPEMVMARALKMANNQMEELKLESAEQKERIKELEPKAEYTDKILATENTVTTTQIAKDFGMSGRELNKILANLKIQYKQAGQWLLYSKYQGMGYTKSYTYRYYNQSYPHTNWTQKGRKFIYDTLVKCGIIQPTGTRCPMPALELGEDLSKGANNNAN